MGIIWESSNKYIYWFDWLVSIIIIAWFLNLNKYVSIIGGILLVLNAILRLIMPHIFPKAKLLFSDQRTHSFFIWVQRGCGLLLMILSLMMLLNYHLNYKTVWLFAFCIFGAFLVVFIIWIILYSRQHTRLARFFIWICTVWSTINCLLFVVHYYFSTYHEEIANKPMSLLDSIDWAVRIIIAILLILVSFILWHLYLKREKEGKKISIMKDIIKAIKAVVITVLGIVIIWLIGGNILASYMEKKTERAWAKNYYSYQYMKQPLPEKKRNNSAIKLQEFIKELGINRVYEDHTHIDTSFEDMKKEMSDYLDQELKKPNNFVSAPPAKLKIFLDTHADTIDAFCDYFANHEAPELGTTKINDLGDYYLLETQDLHRMMIAYALVKLNAGQHQDATKVVDTAWKINQALENVHDRLLVLLFSEGRLKTIAVMLRKIDNVPAYWHNRLKDDEHQESVLFQLEKEILRFNDFELIVKDKLKDEAFSEKYHYNISYEEVKPDRADELRWKYIIGPLIEPYYRICVADYSKRASEFIGQVHKKNDICTSDQYSFICQETHNGSWNKLEIPHASWNEIYDFFRFFAYNDCLIRLEVLWLNLELADKVLQIKEAKKASSDGKWPASIPGIESSTCQGVHWNYRITPDGTMCISISKPPASYEKEYLHPALLLPLTYCQKTGVNY